MSHADPSLRAGLEHLETALALYDVTKGLKLREIQLFRAARAVADLLRAQPPPAPDPRTCQWAIDDVGGDSVYYETQCGHSFQFNDGGATENEFRFCWYCGGQIVDARTSEDMASPPAVAGTRKQEQGESRVDGSPHVPSTGSPAKTTTGGRS
jgi:hypothetical protein